MASGYGNKTPTGRCYPVFMEFKECLSTERDQSKCTDLREDYMECLHHKKEITRLNALVAEREKKIAAHQPVPPLVGDQIKSGEIKLPWTNAS